MQHATYMQVEQIFLGFKMCHYVRSNIEGKKVWGDGTKNKIIFIYFLIYYYFDCFSFPLESTKEVVKINKIVLL